MCRQKIIEDYNGFKNSIFNKNQAEVNKTEDYNNSSSQISSKFTGQSYFSMRNCKECGVY